MVIRPRNRACLPAVFLVILNLALAACTEPLPAEHRRLVGLWENETTRLLITAEGRVEYNAVRGRVTTSLSAPIKHIEGNVLTAGFLWFETRFDLGAGPVEHGDRLALSVDGVELFRRDAAGWSIPD